MSYLSNGSTLRATFRLTPPKTHNPDHSKSEVLAYIMQTIGCGQVEAIRAFNSMRNVKSQVLVYDRIHRQWRGCDWEPDGEQEKKDLESRKLSEIRREIAQIWRAINGLRKMRHRKKKQNGRPKPQDESPREQEEGPSMADELAELMQSIK